MRLLTCVHLVKIWVNTKTKWISESQSFAVVDTGWRAAVVQGCGDTGGDLIDLCQLRIAGIDERFTPPSSVLVWCMVGWCMDFGFNMAAVSQRVACFFDVDGHACSRPDVGIPIGCNDRSI